MVTRFQPRYKYIREERHFDESMFRKDFADLPFSTVDAFSDTEESLDILNSLITDCIERHAPLKRVKVTGALDEGSIYTTTSGTKKHFKSGSTE